MTKKKLDNFLSENSEVIKVIRTIVWIASIVAVIILWYVNDTDAKYVSKDVYNAETTSSERLMGTRFEDLKTHITSENSNIKTQINDVKIDVEKKYDAVNSSVQELRAEQIKLRTQQDRILLHHR